MAANTANDVCIGKLTIDISEIKTEIKDLNEWLGKIGANIDLQDVLTKKISSALKSLVNEAKKAGEEAAKAIKAGTDTGTGDNNSLKDAIKLWKEYYDLMTKAQNARNANRSSQADFLEQEANKIVENVKALREQAEATEAVSKAMRNYQSAQKAGVDKTYLANLRELAKQEKERAKELEATAKAQAKAQQVMDKQKLAEEKDAIEAMVTLLKRKADLETQATKAVMSGNVDNANLYLEEEKKIEALIKALNELYPNLEKHARLNDEVTQSEVRRQAAVNTAKQKAENNELKEREAILERLIKLYRDKATLDAEATKAVAAGNTDNANLYLEEEKRIQAVIDKIRELYPELDKEAQASEKVAAAELKRQAAVNTAKQKSEALEYKELNEAVDKYATALETLYNAQAKLNEDVAASKLTKGTQEYEDRINAIERYKVAAEEAGAVLNSDSRREAEDMDKVTEAVQRATDSFGDLRDAEARANADDTISAQERKVREAETAYKNLATAVRNYNIEKKTGNTDRQNMWAQEVSSQMKVLTNLEQEVNTLNIDEDARKRILSFVEQGRTAQAGMTAETGKTTTGTGELESQVKGLVTRYLSLMAVIRTISSLIKNMTEYVSEYSDKMNEIQMITLKSSTEVAQLADSYRKIAKEMNVSSLDMADAAIYFTRQGLEAEEIEKRLKNVTMYAKAANVEFTDASEIITAVVNSMGLVEQEAEDGRNAAQRVSDVFLQIGDHAATSGQEIGEAMQKAAASAGAFGVSMEWLASYIATVSETTRQEARTIGTAFNTIIARLHQIKQTGYNQEDETKVNDIAKALKNIDVVLMDQEGNWRDMEDILVEIAGKWDGLDGKTKSYIATTMAGVKQQNVFLALMNDMSKGIEGQSRAYELHELAMKSNGVAAEKYGVYLDSVTAAQERLTIAEEKFYSLLDQNVIKSWYDMLAGIVDYITDATDAFDGLNIILPLVAGGIYLVVAAVKALTTAAANAGSMLTLLNKHPVIATISAVTIGIGLLTTAVNLFNDEARRMKKAFEEADKAIDQTNQKIASYKSIQDQLAKMYEEVGEKNQLTSTELSKYNSLLDSLSSISPEAQKAVEDIKDKMVLQKDTVNDLNQEINNLLLSYQKLGAVETIKKISNTYGSGGTSAGLLDYYTDWDKNLFVGETEFEQFSNALKSVFDRANKSYGQSWNRAIESETLITNEVFDIISDWLSKGLDWESIASIVWTEYFKGASSYKPEDIFSEKIKEMVSWAMDSIGQNMNDFDRTAVQEKLMSYLFDFDGTAISKNIGEAAAVISNFVSQVMNEADFDASKLMTAKERLTKFAESMLGELSEDMARSIASMDDASIEKISDAYAGLIEAGFSKADITNLFKDIPIDQWVNSIGYMRVQIMNRIMHSTGVDLHDTNEDGSVDMLMWNQLDLNTMKLIEDLTNTGVALDDIKQIMRESESVDEFNTKINELAKNLNLNSNGEEGTAKSLKDLIKDAKAGIKDIQAIDSAIESVKKNIAEGENINYGDIFGLIELHPELMTVIGDSEKLLEMLKKIREEAGKTQLDSFKSLILKEGKTAGTKYEGSGFETLAEYRASIEGNEEAITEFDAEVERLAQNLQLADENFKQMTKDDKEATKSFSESVKEVEKFDKVIKKLKDNKAVDFSDIIDLSTAHPELIAVSGDIDELRKELEKLRDEAKEVVRIKAEEQVLESSGWLEKNGFAGKGFTSARQILAKTPATLEEKEMQEQVAAAVKESTQNIVDLSGATADLEQSEKDATAAAKEEKNALKEAQQAFKANLSEIETLDSTIAKLQDNKQIDFSNIINLASAHPEIMNFVKDSDTLLEALERLKTAAKEQAKESLKQILLTDSGFYQTSIYYDPRYQNMQQYMDSIRTMKDEWDMVNADMDAVAGKMVEGADASSTAAETWLDAQMKVAEVQDEVNWAKANNFKDQIRQLDEANASGGIQAAIDLFNSWDDKMKQAVGTEYPAFILQMVKARKAMDEQGKETADLTKETEGLSSALKTASKMNSVKYFKDSAKAIKQLSDGTISATDAYDTFNKEVNKVSKAYEDILDVQAKMEYNAKEVNKDNKQKIDVADVTNLSSLLGMTADQIIQDFPAAVEMFDELTGSTGELMDMFNALNEAAFIRITGVSDVDFSNLENGLFAIRADAEDVIKALEATGQWEVTSVDLPQNAQIWDPFNKKWISSSAVASATVLKPTGNNPFARQSTVTQKADTKKRSGGGGGSSKDKDKNDNFRDKNVTTEVEKMLDLMSQVNTIQQSQQNYYQSQQKYYSQTGQLQGVIGYMQKEKEAIEAQNGTLDGNIKKIESYMEAKRAELAQLSTEDEKYSEVADDLDKLQKAHQTYTKQLIDNKTSIESLNQSIEEQRKKIRQMEIDLRNLVLKAIEDREKKRKDMLNSEIEMENKIFDLVQKRYEKERDEILRVTDLKIDALKEERDLLDEQLRIRKEQAEAEDKALKLRELEAKYQRIIADPTRAKEAQNMKAEIDALRKEMAWDLAEDEVKSQQDSIDQQIESLEDYKEYIENYYEDLFEHPQKLIAEMRQIMMGTQEEIIQWLMENDETYRESSENTQLQMVEGWTETYNEMKGILQTYWEEVEEIIAQGDDYIIEFLKNNSSEYAQAGKLQAEAYVDEWKKQLSELRKAYEEVGVSIASNYSTIQQATGTASGSSSSSSRGGSGPAGGSSKTQTTLTGTTSGANGSHYYEFSAFGKNYSADRNAGGQYFTNRGDAYAAAEAKIESLYQSQKATLDRNGANAYGYNQLAQAYKTAKNSIRAYKLGGLADYTGPAWVDGSPQDPERILTPYQTKLFESMVRALETISTIPISTMPNMSGLQSTGANPVSVGDIIVNVDNLDTDDDYETLAEKVGEVLMEKIGRTAVVGGLRIRSI